LQIEDCRLQIERVAAVCAAVALVAAFGGACRLPGKASGGFWFQDVTFAIPAPEVDRLGGPLSQAEKERIISIAQSELQSAYAGLRIAFTNDQHAFYRVRVLQDFGASGASGRSQVFVGGQGSVSFDTIARTAIAYAPPQAGRSTIVDGIGRGIGRTAAHEFAHQIVPGVNLHASADRDSYEFASAERAAQYYGELHWALARAPLAARLGSN
jgi:hypothetical protein